MTTTVYGCSDDLIEFRRSWSFSTCSHGLEATGLRNSIGGAS
jgi:hypothetical protein